MPVSYSKEASEADDRDRLIRYVRLHLGDGNDEVGRRAIDKAWVEADGSRPDGDLELYSFSTSTARHPCFACRSLRDGGSLQGMSATNSFGRPAGRRASCSLTGLIFCLNTSHAACGGPSRMSGFAWCEAQRVFPRHGSAHLTLLRTFPAD
jgi:hypothetical protein